MDGIPGKSAPECTPMSDIQGPLTSTSARSSLTSLLTTTKLHDHDYMACHVSPEQPMSDHDYLSRPVTPSSDTNVRKRSASVLIEDEPQPAKKVKLTLSNALKDLLTAHEKLSVTEILEQLQSKYPGSFR